MSPTILYVEDYPMNMELMRDLLEHAGYSMLEAYDAATALAILEKEVVDLILTDINLPDMDGLALTRIIRETPEFKDIPIIAVTANVMAGDRAKCLEAGCNAYIAKPIMQIELFNTIRRALQSSANSASA